MKFSVGDLIVVKRSGEEGKVVSIINKEMLEVDIHGVTFPIYLDEVDHPYLKWFTAQNKQKKKGASFPEQLPVERPAPSRKVSRGLYLSFLPVYKTIDMEERVDQLKVYFINESEHNVRLKYAVKTSGKTLFHYDSQVHRFSDLYLHYVDWATMNEIPRFEWELTSLADGATVSGQIKIKAARLFEHINTLQTDNLPSFSYLLINDFPEFQMPEPEQKVVPVFRGPVRSVKDIPKYEVDLHIEAILEDCKGLTNSDIIDIQVAELNKYLRLAVNNQQDSMVIIHGLGKGILREAVHNILRQWPEIKSFENTWTPKYGFGATVINFKY